MDSLLWEKKLIGAIAGGVVKPAGMGLSPSDLKHFENALRVALQIEGEGKEVTPEILASRLDEKYPDDNFYTESDFTLFANTAPSAALAFEASDKIKGVALKTYLTTTLSTIVTDETKTGASMLDELKAVIQIADKNYHSSENNFVFAKDVVPKLRAAYEDMFKGVSYSISTGFPLWDDMLLDGFSRGDLHVIAGLTGHGKSALALNCARNQAMAGQVVGVVSREMSDVENLMRIQSTHQEIPRWQMRKGLYDKTFQALCSGLDDLQGMPIAFDIRTLDVETLNVQVKRMVEQFDMKILYVDYLQLMAARNARGSRADDVAATSRGLKLIAMENNIPVVALSQFSRAALNADVTELLQCLKESSGIEQDSSTVSYIQIDNTDSELKTKPAKVQVLKNRNGVTFRPVMLDYRGELFRFTEASYQH